MSVQKTTQSNILILTDSVCFSRRASIVSRSISMFEASLCACGVYGSPWRLSAIRRHSTCLRHISKPSEHSHLAAQQTSRDVSTRLGMILRGFRAIPFSGNAAWGRVPLFNKDDAAWGRIPYFRRKKMSCPGKRGSHKCLNAVFRCKFCGAVGCKHKDCTNCNFEGGIKCKKCGKSGNPEMVH